MKVQDHIRLFLISLFVVGLVYGAFTMPRPNHVQTYDYTPGKN